MTHFPIERAAASLVSHRTPHTALVVVVRPDQADATVIAHDDHIGLRAAVRVAATAGNTRAWRSLGPWIERVDVGALPAVINLAAKRDRIRVCHMGGIYVADRMVAVALWFTRRERDTAAATAYRNDTFSVLRVAAAPDAGAGEATSEAAPMRSEHVRPGVLPL